MDILNVRQQSRNSKLKEMVQPEKVEDLKIQKLQSLIIESKHAVVQHILNARIAHNDLLQIAEMDKSLKTLLQSKLESKANAIGQKALLIDQRILSKVELLANIVGHGADLEKYLNEYNDDDFCSMLESLPGKYHCFYVFMFICL